MKCCRRPGGTATHFYWHSDVPYFTPRRKAKTRNMRKNTM